MQSIQTWIPEAIPFGRDEHSGAEIEQLTSEPVTSTNIYCEQRYTSADGSRVAIARRPFGKPVELWVCDMRSLRLTRVAEGTPLAANAPLNAIYYLVNDDAPCVMRLDLVDLTTRELHRFDHGPAPACCAVSPDEKWFVSGPFHVRDNVYSLRRVDLRTGKTDTLCEIEDMFNPHLQFDPSDGRTLAVQINRGGKSPAGAPRRMIVGPLGATLCLVHVESGKIDPLPAGRPHTPGISGHECWIANTGRILFTAGLYKVSPSSFVTLSQPAEHERHFLPAAIYSAARGETAATVVAKDLLFNHLAASDDGRFFIADDHTTGRIHVGSIATGRYLGLCDGHTRQGACQHSHMHAYMTPDNQFVIYNSTVTGVTQVYAARVPPDFLNQL